MDLEDECRYCLFCLLKGIFTEAEDGLCEKCKEEIIKKVGGNICLQDTLHQ